MTIIGVLACLVLIAFGLYGFYLFGSGPKQCNPNYTEVLLIGLSPMLFFVGLLGLAIVLFF